MEELQATTSATALSKRIETLIDAGRPAVARPLLVAVRRMAPPSPQLAQLAARLAVREGHNDLALQELDAAITLNPDHAGLRKCRADVRVQMGDKEGAAADAAEAVILDSTDPAAKAMLGLVLMELGRAADAVACLAEAATGDPGNPIFLEGLAAAQEADGDSDAALASLEAGIAAAPSRVELRNAAILLSIRRRDFTGALRLAEAARIAGTADACTFGLAGHALSSLERHVEAGDAYAEALKLGPNDPYVRHLVAASGSLPSAARAPVEYVRTVFDGYADRFELHLLSLGYRVPCLFRDVLAKHPAVANRQRVGPVLDLGCGTGLMALAISDLPFGPLTGVDLSPRMLAHAAAKQLYEDLHETDLIQFLAEDTTRWGLILAADVLLYFGALSDVFAAARARIQSGGWFIFSLEELLPDHDGTLHGNGDWALQRMGRFAHSVSYVTRAAPKAGFAIRSLERHTMRNEAGGPVSGILVVLQAGAA